MVYIMPSLAHFDGWTLVGEALLYIVHLLLQFKEKEGQGFADIIVDCCVDGVFSICYCKCVYVFHLFLCC